MYLLFVRCLFNQLYHFAAYKALLMLWTRDPPEKLTVLQWLKKMPACYGTQSFLTQSMPCYRVYWQSTSILPSCLHLGLPVGLFSSLYLNPICISVPPFPWQYVTCALPISSSFILLPLFCEEWAGYLSQYSDWLMLKPLSLQSNTTHEITQQISHKFLRMDVLTFETCWALNNEIIKQVTSSWSIFMQLLEPLLCTVPDRNSLRISAANIIVALWTRGAVYSTGHVNFQIR